MMRMRRSAIAAWVSVVLLAGLHPARASGQVTFESTGERALGMAGAFVAVADDATAAYWNPAGLATGGPAGMTIGWRRLQVGDPSAAPHVGPQRARSTFTSLGTWPIGLSYGSFELTTLGTSPDGALETRSIHTSQVGVTVLQSLLADLVVGSTLKLLRSDVASGPVDGATVADVLASGAARRGSRRTTFDLDLGILATAPRARVGLTVRNLRSPMLGAVAGNPVTLPREARFGVAVLPTDGLTLALDVDLNTVDLTGGPRRNGALGVEAALSSRFVIRSGLRWSLVGARRPVGAVGASVGLRRGFWLDGHYAAGRASEDREVGVALRAGF